MGDFLAALLMGPVRRYTEAWIVILNPWVLLLEQPAISDTAFDLFPTPSEHPQAVALRRWVDGRDG